MSTIASMRIPLFPTMLAQAGTTSFSFIQNPIPTESAFSHFKPSPFSAPAAFDAHETTRPNPNLRLLVTAASAQGDAEALHKVRKHLDEGRAALRDKNWTAVASSYRSMLEILEEPYLLVDRGESPPLFQVIRNGQELYREAVFAFASFSDHQDTPQHLSRLEVVKRDLTDSDGNITDPQEYARAEMLRAYVMMRYAGATNVQRVHHYERAVKVVKGTRKLFDPQANPELRNASDFLLLELYSRQLERAHHRDAFALRRRLIDKATAKSERILGQHTTHDDSLKDVASLYEANLIRLFARMNLWGLALKRARTLTTEPAYAESAGARVLLADPLFEKFVLVRTDEDGEEKRSFKTIEQIKADSTAVRRFLRKFQAALANAHSSSLGQTVGIGVASMLTTMGAELLMFNGSVPSVALAAVVAAAATAANRLRNGWNTLEAQQTSDIGVYDRTLAQSASDVGKGMLIGGLETGLWLAPSSLLPVLPEAGTLAWNTFGNAGDLYARFFKWMGHGIANMSPETMTPDLSGGLGANLFRAYLGLTAVQYASSMLLPKSPKFDPYRNILKKSSKMFVLGALGLGAVAGMSITGEHMNWSEFLTDNGAFWNRAGRSTIAVIGGLSMLLTGGVVALAKNKSVKDCAVSLGRGIWDMDHNALVAIGLSYGVTSAMGGQMQRGARPDDPALLAVLGASTLISLLPIVFGISGVMKGNISLLPGIREGFQESRGLHPLKRVWHAAAGAADAFKTPYVYNRGGRVFHLDILPAAVRTYIGFDTNGGAAASEAISWGATNPTATMWQPETGRSIWEQNAMKDMLRKGESDKLGDHWRKAAQRLVVSHPLLGHQVRDRLFPFYAIKRLFRPPTFPLAPQTHYHSGLHQMITDVFDEETTGALLDEIAAFTLDAAHIDADDPNSSKRAQRLSSLDVARELIKVAYIARNDPRNGRTISEFFDKNSWLMDLVGLDPEEIPVIPVEEGEDGEEAYAREYRFSRNRRAFIRSQVALPTERYEGRVKEHAARDTKTALTEDLFQMETPPSEAKSEAKEANAEAKQAKLSAVYKTALLTQLFLLTHH